MDNSQYHKQKNTLLVSGCYAGIEWIGLGMLHGGESGELGHRPLSHGKHASRRQRGDGQVRFKLLRFADNGKTLIDVLRILDLVKYSHGEIGVTHITFAF